MKYLQTRAAVLRLSETEYGSHEHAKLARVRRLLLNWAEQSDPQYLVVDLSTIHYFGARFVAILVSTWKLLRKRNRRLALCGPMPLCAELIQNVQLGRLFDIYPTQRIALEEIERHVHDKAEKSRTTREELRMDQRALMARKPDCWYEDRPAPYSQPARAC
jgi:anti-anti-sigma factor